MKNAENFDAKKLLDIPIYFFMIYSWKATFYLVAPIHSSL